MTRAIGKCVRAIVAGGVFGAGALAGMASAQNGAVAPVLPAGAAALRQAAPASQAPIRNEAGTIRYIVLFADTAAQRYSAKAVSDPRFGADHDGKVMRLLHEVEAAHRVAATHAYSHTLQGFAAYLTEQQVTALRRDARIKSVSPDIEAEASASAVWTDVQVGASTLPWGVQAVGGSAASTGGATVYVIDSGIANHVDVPVSARWNAPGACAIGKYPHATFVAGIIAAKNDNAGVTGVNAGARLVSLAYGDPTCAAGSNSFANVIAALDEAKRRILAEGRMGVVNLSSNFQMVNLTPDRMPLVAAFQKSVRALIAPDSASGYRGAVFVQSAGNRYNDACFYSFNDKLPSDGALVVGAIDSNGQPAQPLNGSGAFAPLDPKGVTEMGSNFGSCVDAWAPGKNVRSTWMNSYGSTYVVSSGTSWAAPHVSALAARLIETTPTLRTPGEVENAIRARLVSGGALTQGTPLRVASIAGAAHKARPTVEFKIGAQRSSPSPAMLGAAPNPALTAATPFELRYEALGAQSCDMRAYVDGNLVEQKLAGPTSFNWGSVTRAPGLHRWDVDCRSASGETNSASASARVARGLEPVITFSVDGVPTTNGVPPVSTSVPVTVSYQVTNATSCTAEAYRRLPVEFFETWYDNKNAPTSMRWAPLKLVSGGEYYWRVVCVNRNAPGAPESQESVGLQAI
ncbi:S8 family serine peptidase [Massilia violaceinigra]|uniref:S8 family serine peptidase n=1 Tax=Massilia violaceinigra TaxID=2045208 RepID=A0ABY4A2S9_9BURK|nr:S8 family serine peptidase [Massilia violaceinigra]UOD27866.1 S8 family serine peptidase [Massilia violaceinigra]